MPDKVCINCFYFGEFGGPDLLKGIDGLGRCHRNPPTSTGQMTATFPIVQAEWWCGEYRMSEGPTLDPDAPRIDASLPEELPPDPVATSDEMWPTGTPVKRKRRTTEHKLLD